MLSLVLQVIETMNQTPPITPFLADFFSPLRTSDADTLPFPGFGFWSRKYAQDLETTLIQTLNFGSVLGDQASLCTVLMELAVQNTEMCPMKWDSLSCFPATEVGQLSVIPCPKYIKQVPYDTNGKSLFNTMISKNVASPQNF